MTPVCQGQGPPVISPAQPWTAHGLTRRREPIKGNSNPALSVTGELGDAWEGCHLRPGVKLPAEVSPGGGRAGQVGLEEAERALGRPDSAADVRHLPSPPLLLSSLYS